MQKHSRRFWVRAFTTCLDQCIVWGGAGSRGFTCVLSPHPGHEWPGVILHKGGGHEPFQLTLRAFGQQVIVRVIGRDYFNQWISAGELDCGIYMW